MKQIQLQVVYFTKTGTLSRQIPTFWLDSSVETCKLAVSKMFYGSISIHGTIMEEDYTIHNIDLFRSKKQIA